MINNDELIIFYVTTFCFSVFGKIELITIKTISGLKQIFLLIRDQHFIPM